MNLTSLTATMPIPVDRISTPALDVEAAFDCAADSLYRYFVVRTGSDRHLADDLMQQLWLQAISSDASMPQAEVEAWLFGIARNLIRLQWRRRKRRPGEIPIADPALASQLAKRLVSEELPADVFERRELADQLMLAITELRSAEQDLIMGRYFDHLSHEQLGKRLGCESRAVEGRLYRARQALRGKLAALEPQEGLS